jgi:uncharacterized protein (TIGR02001 family)
MKLDGAESDPTTPPAAALGLFSRSGRGCGVGCVLLAATVIAAHREARAVSFGGELSVTSDYIYRGLSESDGHPAAQIDLHLSTASGTFAGIWSSTRAQSLAPRAAADIEAYLGQRLMLSSSWSLSLAARSHNYVGGTQTASNDYQEIAASLSYLDLWTFSISAIPNAVRYNAHGVRVGRYPAYVAETSAQWLIGHGLFLTGGAGYYYVSAGAWTRPSWDTTPVDTQAQQLTYSMPGTGYAYGNVGLAYQLNNWRLDVGYYLSQQHAAERLFPYPAVNRQVAATLSWQF